MLSHKLFQLKRALRVQARHRFIQYPHLRLVDKRSNYHQLLLHAVTVTAYKVGQSICQFEHVGVVPYACSKGFSVDAIHCADKVEVLRTLQCFVGFVVVGYKTDLLLGGYRIVGNVDAVNFYCALARRQYAGNHLDCSRFSCAVGTEKTEYLTVIYLQRNVVHCFYVGFGVSFTYMSQSYHCFFHLLLLFAAPIKVSSMPSAM